MVRLNVKAQIQQFLPRHQRKIRPYYSEIYCPFVNSIFDLFIDYDLSELTVVSPELDLHLT